MKHILMPFAAAIVVGFCVNAAAGPFDVGESALISRLIAETPSQPPAEVKRPVTPVRTANLSAPKLDATAPPVEVAPPIPAGTVAQPEVTTAEHHQATMHHRRYPPAETKQNMFDKLRELERKKNAWLKRTFLGR